MNQKKNQNYKLLRDLLVEEKKSREISEDPIQIREVIPIEEFFTPYYIGNLAYKYKDFWKKCNIDFWNSGKYEIVISGSLGSGKTSFSWVNLLYKLYVLSCFMYPAKLWGFPGTSEIVIGYISVKNTVAKREFGKLINIMDSSIYWRDVYKRDTSVSSIIKFPNIIIIPTSTVSDFISSDLISVILDEANFYTRSGKETKNIGDLEKARDIYDSCVTRILSRFEGCKMHPLLEKMKNKTARNGALFQIVSSSTYDTSFTNERIKQGEPYVVYGCVYKVYPERYSNKKFAVFIGYKNIEPMILRTIDDIYRLVKLFNKKFNKNDFQLSYEEVFNKYINEELKIGNLIEYVPNDFYSNFQQNLIISLQNISGIPVSSISSFFSDVGSWNKCIDVELNHPFVTTSIIVSKFNESNELINSFLYNSVVKKYLVYETDTEFDIEQNKDEFKNELLKSFNFYGEMNNNTGEYENRPIIHPDAERFVHIDLSESVDCCGIAMCHIGEYRYDEFSDVELPIIYYDFMIQINHLNFQIKLSHEKIRNFIFWLRDFCGYNIVRISQDTHQYYSFQEIFEKGNFKFIIVSNEGLDNWLLFNQMLVENRIRFYYYDIFKTEYFNLVLDLEKNKVDHPKKFYDGSRGSKDVADAVVGALKNCLSFYEKRK